MITSKDAKYLEFFSEAFALLPPKRQREYLAVEQKFIASLALDDRLAKPRGGPWTEGRRQRFQESIEERKKSFVFNIVVAGHGSDATTWLDVYIDTLENTARLFNVMPKTLSIMLSKAKTSGKDYAKFELNETAAKVTKVAKVDGMEVITPAPAWRIRDILRGAHIPGYLKKNPDRTPDLFRERMY